MITKAELIALLQQATHIPDDAVLLTESDGLHLVAPAKVTGMIVPSPVKVRGTYWDVEIVKEGANTFTIG